MRRRFLLHVGVALVLATTVDPAVAQQNDLEMDMRAPGDRLPPAAVLTEAENVARERLFTELRSPHDNIRWVALRAATELRDPWVAEAAKSMCESSDILEQVLALELIANTDPASGTPQFLTALRSSDRAVRLRGLLGLEQVADPVTVLDIGRLLQDEEDPDLRATAARALGSIGDAAAVPALYSAVGDSHATVRRAAVVALVEIGDTDVGRYLVSRLQRARRFDILPLLRLLTLVRDPSLVPDLRPFLDHELDEVRAWAAAAVLAAVEDEQILEP